MKKERGLSLIGFIFLAAVTAFVVFTAFRCVPAWSEYFALKKVLQSTANEFNADAPIPAVRSAFERRAEIDDIPVRGSQLDIRKDNGRITISVQYARQVPIAGNVSLLFNFDAKATGLR